MKKQINRNRNSTTEATKPYTSVVDLEITELYKHSEKNEMFLLFDSGKIQDRILIFATMSNLAKLSSIKHWHCDGTFDSSPLLFKQVCTIHGIIAGYVIP